LAQRYFAPEEVSSLMKMTASKRKEAFFRCWSTKEAFIKVVGRGLSIGLSNFEVEMEPARPPRIIKTIDTLASIDTWICKQLPMGDSMAGVVAVEGKLGEVTLYHYMF
jgi:4'-phosphopantetheinyl transferase